MCAGITDDQPTTLSPRHLALQSINEPGSPRPSISQVIAEHDGNIENMP